MKFFSARRIFTSVIVSSVLIVLSCQREPIINVSTPDPVLERLLKLGIGRSRIVDEGSRYVVDGDIAFNKRKDSGKNARPGQRMQGPEPLIAYEDVDYITVNVDNSFSCNYRSRPNIK